MVLSTANQLVEMSHKRFEFPKSSLDHLHLHGSFCSLSEQQRESCLHNTVDIALSQSQETKRTCHETYSRVTVLPELGILSSTIEIPLVHTQKIAHSMKHRYTRPKHTQADDHLFANTNRYDTQKGIPDDRQTLLTLSEFKLPQIKRKYETEIN